MAVHTYSTYEAKARFSEVLQRVREGHRVVITYRGKEVAEILPIARKGGSWIEDRLASLETGGEIVRPKQSPSTGFRPLARRAGALERFLDSRDR